MTDFLDEQFSGKYARASRDEVEERGEAKRPGETGLDAGMTFSGLERR